MRTSSRPLTLAVGAVLTVSLTAPAGGIPAAVSAPPVVVRPSKPDVVRSVNGTDAIQLPPATTAEAPAARPAAKAQGPSGTVEVAVRAPSGGSARSALETSTRAGGLPVWIDGVRTDGPSKVAVRWTAGQRPSVAVRRTDGGTARGPVRVTVDYSAFRDSFGADWAARLALTPAAAGSTVSAVHNDVASGRLTAEVLVGATDSTFALAAAPTGSTGDYKATSLSPSGKWQVSASTGAFAWSYGLRVPPVPGELAPDLSVSYSSNAVDGRTVSTNSQPSWLGEGWSLWPGYLERAYKGCADDLNGNNGTTKTGDLCWETENATVSFGDHSGQLVLAGGSWRLKDDDGTKVERLTGAGNGDGGDPANSGEHWRITTTDGTQYFFGRRSDSAWTVPVFGNDSGEPCYQAGSFDASQCEQAYRWNLDYVVDVHGNSLTYTYREETNNYAVNIGRRTATYTRGGTLERIDYGTRDGQGGQAPARVLFDVTDRCLTNCGVHDATTWPDVPWDQDCASGPCTGKWSPTFWSTKRLTRVSTQISAGGGNYRDVDRWDFAHTFPVPGDNTTAALWLSSITMTGLAATPSIALPPVTFEGTMLQNRVNSVADGLPKLNKNRITTIKTEAGGAINIGYAAPDCPDGGTPPVADDNRTRCFPVRWAMPPSPTVRDDWFHRYVVAKVVEDDVVGGNKDQVSSYEYQGGGAWAYDDNPLVETSKRTWSQWRGYEKVVVRKGDPVNDLNKPESWTLHQTFRGMNGDKRADGSTRRAEIRDSAGTVIPDDEQLAGFERETITRNGVTGGQLGEEVAGEIHSPFSRLTGTQDQAGAAPLKAFQLEDAGTVTRTRRADGSFRSTRLGTTYDEYGNATQIDDAGDLADATDDRCTTTTYAKNTAKLLVNLVKTVKTVGAACGSTPSFPADAINDTRTYYDNGTLDAPPTKGDVTMTETAKSYTGSTPVYLANSASSPDAFGRGEWTDDALDRRTSTTFTQTNGLTTSTRVSNPLAHQATTTVDPAWGLPLTVGDANSRTTSMKYDALGRLVKVWKPGRTEAHGDSPHVRYTYQVRNTAPSTIRTDTLKANSNTVATYQLLDGFLRERQTQVPSPQGGRVLTDTLYDSRGLVNVTRAPYYHKDSPPGTTLFVPNAGEVPNATVKVYDGAERETDSIYTKLNVEQWRTRIYPAGDRTSVVPPQGGTATTTITDARGQTTTLLQYKQRPATGAPTGTADTTSYAFTKAGRLASLTDPAGNVWRYEYDALGNRTRTDDPDHGVSIMTYDDAGQPITSTDARGNKLVATFDDLGRKTRTRLGSATGTVLSDSVYDTLAKGELTSSTSFSGPNAYTRAITGYDAAGRPTGESTVIPAAEGALAGTYTSTLAYNADGSAASISLPALGADAGQVPAETLSYGYDDLGQPDIVTGATTYVTNTEYTALGEPTQVELGADGKKLWQTTYREEGTRRVSEVLTERQQASGVLVHDLRYGYDQSDNVTKIADRTAGSTADTQCFQYDYLRRVSSAWTPTDDCAGAPATALIGGPAPYWHQFGYDATGNRKTQTKKGLGGAADTVSSYNYPAGGDGTDRPHAVTSVQTGQTTANYRYDAAGNTITRPGPGGAQTMSWDERGRLSSIGSAQGPTSYVYDADGKQLVRRDPGSVTLFVAGGEVTLDTAGKTATGTRYYEDRATRTPAGLTWLVSDHHGTSQVAVDADSLTATPRRLDLFGNTRGPSGVAATAAWPGGNRGFVGGTINPASGLTRLGAREYDPALGKFISADPISDPADPQQLNGYSYANNNPTSSSDASGLRLFEGDDGHWTDSGVYRPPASPPPPAADPGCDGRTHCANPSRGDNLPPGNSKLWQPVTVKGRKIGKETVKNFREFGYRGSDDVTYAELLEFSAQGNDQFVVACTALGGLSNPNANWMGPCTEGMAIQGDPTVWIAKTAKILYELTPVADFQHCFDGSDSCWWILTNIPGGKLTKIPKIVEEAVDVADSARRFGPHGVDDLRSAAQAPDRNGLTQVGRGLQKHSSRQDSVFAGLSTGNATARNDQGLRVLDEILNDTGGRTEVLDRVINIWDSTGRGARFSNDGSFMGFLEPGR